MTTTPVFTASSQGRDLAPIDWELGIVFDARKGIDGTVYCRPARQYTDSPTRFNVPLGLLQSFGHVTERCPGVVELESTGTDRVLVLVAGCTGLRLWTDILVGPPAVLAWSARTEVLVSQLNQHLKPVHHEHEGIVVGPANSPWSFAIRRHGVYRRFKVKEVWIVSYDPASPFELSVRQLAREQALRWYKGARAA